MRKNSAPRFNGKLKKEIADEAFAKLGVEATIQQVDAHFRRYKLPHCERSMYWAARRRAEGKPVPVRRRYPRKQDSALDSAFDLLLRVKQLVVEAGGFDALEENIGHLKRLQEIKDAK